MNEYDENINTHAEVTETPADDANAPDATNMPESETSANGDEAAVNAGVYVHRFRKPFEHEGKKYIRTCR